MICPEVPLASLDKAIAAVAEISALVISPSRIFALVTESVARSAATIDPSTILEPFTEFAAKSERTIALFKFSFE